MRNEKLEMNKNSFIKSKLENRMMKRVLMAFLISHLTFGRACSCSAEPSLLRLCSLLIAAFSFLICYAQDVIVNPDISYAGTPRSCEIGGLTVKGVEGYED